MFHTAWKASVGKGLENSHGDCDISGLGSEVVVVIAASNDLMAALVNSE